MEISVISTYIMGDSLAWLLSVTAYDTMWDSNYSKSKHKKWLQ